MWKHTKHKKLTFKATLRKVEGGEKVFSLTCVEKKMKPIDFNSWQAAKQAGWSKV